MSRCRADADDDARTTYRPVYEGASVPGDIRGDVRRAVDGDAGEDAGQAPPVEEDPLVREMFEEEEGGIDDFDLSQLRTRPITSDGRAGISRDVTEYVERLEAAGAASAGAGARSTARTRTISRPRAPMKRRKARMCSLNPQKRDTAPRRASTPACC